MVTKNPRQVTTGKVRISYANVWEPRANQDGKEKYSASFIIPKSDTTTISAIEKAIAAAIQDGIERGKFPRGIKPGQLKNPLRDGDEERNDEAYADSMFVNANSNERPEIVGPDVKPLLERRRLFSGCYVHAVLTFYAYDVNGNRGVACGLGPIQLVDEGPALGGVAAKASDEFTAITEEDDDFLG